MNTVNCIVDLDLITLYIFPSPGGYIHNAAGDRGEAYVHDTTGDFGPYHYWKLRQQVGSLASLDSLASLASMFVIFVGEGAR